MTQGEIIISVESGELVALHITRIKMVKNCTYKALFYHHHITPKFSVKGFLFTSQYGAAAMQGAGSPTGNYTWLNVPPKDTTTDCDGAGFESLTL